MIAISFGVVSFLLLGGFAFITFKITSKKQGKLNANYFTFVFPILDDQFQLIIQKELHIIL